MELLERSDQLSLLNRLFDAVAAGQGGRMVLVRGEAGVGKTSLLRQFLDQRRQGGRILSGACDALFTPRPLGAFIDIAQLTGGDLEDTIQSGGKPYEVADALMRELRAGPPVIVVVEDVHWADEATLDVLRLLGRRVGAAPALVIASYRDEALDRTHPLRIFLGELPAGETTVHVSLAPLSLEAVIRLARPHGLDADELFRMTGGNPFFVTEVLAAGEERIPHTIRDAVLARAARLTDRAQQLLEAVAVAPPQAELWLLQQVAPAAVDRVEECLSAGILMSVPEAVTFRHELARLAIQESVPLDRRVALHRGIFDVLSARPAAGFEPGRVAHHAEGAGEAEAVLRWSQLAAERATTLGAHREAAAHYATALRFASGFARERLADLLERRAYACYLTGQFAEAIDAQQRALECHRTLHDRLREGDGLRSLSRLVRYMGRTEEALVLGREAVMLLEQLDPGRELALAYCNLSHLFTNSEDIDQAVAWATRALDLADRLEDTEARVYALINLGTLEYVAGLPAGLDKLEHSLEMAQAAGLDEHAGRVFVAFVWWAPRDKSYAVADVHLEPGLEYCREHGLDLWRFYLLAYQARRDMDLGAWDAAVATAGQVIRDPRCTPVPRIVALAVLGLVRARRGDPDCWSPLDEAWSLAESTAELQRIEPVAAARAEAAWLEGRLEGIPAITASAMNLAALRRAPWIVGELACWRRRSGLDEPVPEYAAEPYARELAGDWERAADLLTRLGCTYDSALALAGSASEEPLRRALAEFQRLGARAAAGVVTRRLRGLGTRHLPRGPRPATAKHPAHLTARELQVFGLVAEGLRNSEIAQRLFLSERTVDHHVSAILAKLEVRSRGDAMRRAAELGVVSPK